MKNQLQLIADPGKQEFFIIREFDAPRELVFKAFTNVNLLEQFFAPDNRTTKFEYADYEDAGRYKYSTSDLQGRVLCTFKGVFHEVTEPERIIQTSEMEGLPVKGNAALEAMIFENLEGGRTKLTIHSLCMSVNIRDMIISSGMADGLEQIFRKLDALL